MSSAGTSVSAQESRDDILKAAIRLFASRGFHETSMSEVARDAKVSKALIFWHFKSKEELFLAVLGRLLEPYYIDFAEESQELDERAQIQKLIELYLLFVHDNASSVRFFIAQLLHNERTSDALGGQVLQLYDGYRGMMVDLIRRAQAKELCSLNTTPEGTAGFVLSTLSGFLIESLFIGNPALNQTETVRILVDWLFASPAQKTGERGKAVA